MPWLKLVISMREPISRASSMLIHNEHKRQTGCLANFTLEYCLLEDSQISLQKDASNMLNRYASSVRPWLEVWPKDQIHIIQYEELIDKELETVELQRLKRFLGINESLPTEGLGRHNSRKHRIMPDGWPMRRSVYETLVDGVRKDMHDLLDLLEEHNALRDRNAWARRWEDVWSRNFERCFDTTPDAICNILLS